MAERFNLIRRVINEEISKIKPRIIKKVEEIKPEDWSGVERRSSPRVYGQQGKFHSKDVARRQLKGIVKNSDNL